MPTPNHIEAATSETSRLLSELDRAIDRSSVTREIVARYQRLRSIENITGPSRLTRVLRKEIQIMESRLRSLRNRQNLSNDQVFSVA